jgi:DNA-binding transcriptional ArsR family regulator
VPKPPPSSSIEPPNPVYEEVRAVRDLVEQVIGVLTYTAQDPAANARRETELMKFFGRGSRRPEIYLALDKDRNISEVAAALGMKRQNVSADIALLKDAGLIVPLHTGGRGDVWIRNPVIEAVVGLSRKLVSWRGDSAPTADHGTPSDRERTE